MIKLLTTLEQLKDKPNTLPMVHDAMVAHALLAAIKHHKCKIIPAGFFSPIYDDAGNVLAGGGVSEFETDNSNEIHEITENLLKKWFDIKDI